MRARPLAALAVLVLVLAACAPRVTGLGPLDTPPDLGPDAFVSADGTRLPLRVTEPGGPPRAVAVALHGFNDYGNAFAAPARDWAARGILTLAPDQRGFGQTPTRGLWAGTEAMVRDAVDLVRAARTRWPDVPLVLVGESMGAAVALVALAGDPDLPVDRAVLLAPAVRDWDTLGPVGRAFFTLAAHTLPWLEVRPRVRVTPSDNRAMLVALARDPLVIKRTRVDSAYGLVRLMDAAQDAAPALTHPTLVLWGDGEELIPGGAQERFNAALPDTARVERIDTGFHMLLRDVNAAPVRRRVGDWILGLE